MKFPTCFTLSEVLGLWDAAAILGWDTSFDAVWPARRAGDDAGVVDADVADRPRGDGHEPGVLVPIGVGEDDGGVFKHGWALYQGDFRLRKFFVFFSRKNVLSAQLIPRNSKEVIWVRTAIKRSSLFLVF